jgi:thiamine biosynthesis lipoprotein
MVISQTLPNTERYAHFAMATEFELFVADKHAKHRPAIAAEVFREIDRLENELSRFLEGSDIYRLNHARPGSRLPVSPDTFTCLQLAFSMTQRTRGAFDITYASSKHCRGTREDPLLLDENDLSVEVCTAGLTLDLGGLGKGYALDRVRFLLVDWGINRCLIHGGGSSILAMDPPEGMSGWPVRVGAADRPTLLAMNRLALGASGREVRGEHIVDARRGCHGDRHDRVLRSWVTASQAAMADALATAFMVMSPEEVAACCAVNHDVGALLHLQDPGGHETSRSLTMGNWPKGGPWV